MDKYAVTAVVVVEADDTDHAIEQVADLLNYTSVLDRSFATPVQVAVLGGRTGDRQPGEVVPSENRLTAKKRGVE